MRFINKPADYKYHPVGRVKKTKGKIVVKFKKKIKV
jgi:hypothetical protein